MARGPAGGGGQSGWALPHRQDPHPHPHPPDEVSTSEALGRRPVWDGLMGPHRKTWGPTPRPRCGAAAPPLPMLQALPGQASLTSLRAHGHPTGRIPPTAERQRLRKQPAQRELNRAPLSPPRTPGYRRSPCTWGSGVTGLWHPPPSGTASSRRSLIWLSVLEQRAPRPEPPPREGEGPTGPE